MWGVYSHKEAMPFFRQCFKVRLLDQKSEE